MILQRILPIAIMAVVGLPILVLNLSAIGRWADFEQSDAGDGTPTAPAGLAGLGQAINGLWDGHVDRNRREAVFDATTLTKLRSVTYSRPVTLDAMPGDPDIDPVFHDLTMLARAPAHSMATCPELLADLATVCAVGKVSITQLKAGDYMLKTTFGYLPGYDFGDLSGMAGAELDSERIVLTRGWSRDGVAGPDLPALRTAFYEKALSECAALRDRVGSCAIADLTIEERPHTSKEGYFLVRSQVTMNWLRAPGQAEDAGAVAEAEPVTPPSGVSLFARVGDAVSNAASAVTSTVSGGSAEAEPVKPTVRNGGNAFRAAGGANFRKVDPG